VIAASAIKYSSPDRWIASPPWQAAELRHDEGFEFAEVDLEEPPLLFFSAIVDFCPSRSEATRARGGSRRRAIYRRPGHAEAQAGRGGGERVLPRVIRRSRP
jgi:hypothetical protein